MDFKILTPITTVCSLTSFILVALVYEFPLGVVIFLFESEALAIATLNLYYFVSLMLGDNFPDSHGLISALSFAHLIFYGSLSIVLMVKYTGGDKFGGYQPDIFYDDYRTKVLIGSVLGLVTSFLLIVEFVLPFYTTKLRVSNCATVIEED